MLSLNLLDYNHVCNLFLVKNDSSLGSYQKTHSKKLFTLTKGINNVCHNLKTGIFNFSKYKLPKKEESFYLKVCNLPFNPLKLNLQILCYHLNYYIETSSGKKFLVKILKFKKINSEILPLLSTLKSNVLELSQIFKKVNLTICYIRKFCLLDAALGFYMAKLRHTNLSLTFVQLLDQYWMLLTNTPNFQISQISRVYVIVINY